MGWVKLEDRYARHPKIMAAGEAGLALDICGLCYAREQGTDGFVPEAMLKLLGPVRNPKRAVVELERVGRWIRDDGLAGWWIHDFTEFNPSNEQDDAAAEARRVKARNAARARWGASGNAQASCPVDAAGTGPNMPPSLPLPTPLNPPPSVGPPRTRGSRIPDGFDVDEAMADWAETECPLVEPIMRETQQFYDYWKAASGKTAVKLDWGRAWKVWMRKAQIDAERRQRGSRQAELRR